MFGTPTPHDTGIEQTVLGIFIIDAKKRSEFIAEIKVDCFFHLQHQTIFRFINILHSNRQAVDATILVSVIKNSGELAAIGGAEYILQLYETVTTTTNTAHYIKRLLEFAHRRQMLLALEASTNNVHNLDFDIGELVAENRKILNEIETKDVQSSSELKELVDTEIEKIDKNKGSYGITGLKTGFDKLDYITNGLQNSDFIVIAARPSMGKTAFALNIALNVAKKQDANIVIFSLEMSKEQLTQRIISNIANIPLNKIRSTRLDKNDWVKLVNARKEVEKLNIIIDDTGGLNIEKMYAKCLKLHNADKLTLIIVDYLQLLRGKGYGANRNNEVGEVSRSLKQIAKETNVPVIALAQLSRNVESRDNKRPVMSDLRESGSIEQDADIIMMLYRDDYYRHKDEPKDGRTEVIFRKHRNGMLDDFKLTFVPEHSLFKNIYDTYI